MVEVYLTPEFIAKEEIDPAIFKTLKFKVLKTEGENCYIFSSSYNIWYYVKKNYLINCKGIKHAPDFELRYMLAQGGKRDD